MFYHISKCPIWGYLHEYAKIWIRNTTRTHSHGIFRPSHGYQPPCPGSHCSYSSYYAMLNPVQSHCVVHLRPVQVHLDDSFSQQSPPLRRRAHNEFQKRSLGSHRVADIQRSHGYHAPCAGGDHSNSSYFVMLNNVPSHGVVKLCASAPGWLVLTTNGIQSVSQDCSLASHRIAIFLPCTLRWWSPLKSLICSDAQCCSKLLCSSTTALLPVTFC